MRLESSDRWRAPGIELFLLEPGVVTEQYVDWLNDPDINRFLESRFARHDLASTRAFVQEALDNSDVLFLGIRSDGRHVGNIKLGPLDRRHGLGEIGIMIGDRSVWGKGVASAAIEVITQIAREELGLRKLTAGCYGSNKGSARAFEKAGFSVEGVRPAHYLLDGKPEDHVLLARLLR
jgi:RimJ/RimL family protein N-acetyltransferase